MNKFSQKQHLISSLPCHPKDIQIHILRHQKYVKSITQVIDPEEIPSHLVSRLLRDAKRIKMLQKVTLKWNYQPDQIKPEIVKSLVKTHSQSLKKLSLDISCLILPYQFRNILVPLKNIQTLTIASNPNEIKSLDRLRTLQALSLHFGYDTIEPQVILKSLIRLPNLSEIHTLSTSKSLDKVLLLSEQFSQSSPNRQVKFHISTEGEQEYSCIPRLSQQAQENITSLHFQAVQFTGLFDDLNRKAPLLFQNLKSLCLTFKCLGLRADEWFQYLKAFSQLETLSLDFIGHQDNILSHDSLQHFHLPKSLKSLELKGLVSFSELMDSPQDFACFLSAFRGMNSLRSLSFEFELFEDFQPSYTTFFVSLVQLLPTLSSLNLNVYSMVFDNEDQESMGSQLNYYFDLAPFLAACSSLKNLQQLCLCMPNFLFEDASIISPLPELKVLSLRVLEDENTVYDFNNITKSLDKLIKSVSLSSPNLNELILDFPEVIEEDEILSRCRLLREFQSLRSLGVKLSIPNCSEYTVRGMGEMLNSAVKLENLWIRFFESDHSLFKLKEYLKHHKSVRKMLVYLDSSNLFYDNGLMNDLEAEFKDLGSFVSENSPDNNNDDLLLNLYRP